MSQYCTFYLDKDLFGVGILSVQEIVRSQEITPVPHAPPFVEGLMNLRGQIVLAVNLRKIFRPGSIRWERDPVNIILTVQGEPVSLMADRAGDVLEFPAGSLVTPPNPMDGPVARLIKGVHKLEGALLHVLDPMAIFDQTQFLSTDAYSQPSVQEKK